MKFDTPIICFLFIFPAMLVPKQNVFGLTEAPESPDLLDPLDPCSSHNMAAESQDSSLIRSRSFWKQIFQTEKWPLG